MAKKLFGLCGVVCAERVDRFERKRYSEGETFIFGKRSYGVFLLENGAHFLT